MKYTFHLTDGRYMRYSTTRMQWYVTRGFRYGRQYIPRSCVVFYLREFGR